MRAGAAVLLALVAAPASGEELSVDYDLLFADQAARVQRPAPGLERLELPGPVIVERRGSGVRAVDQSGWGAAGCALDRLFLAAAVARLCPGQFDPAARDRIAGQLLRGVDFFARNTVPPLSPEARRAAMLSRLETLEADDLGRPAMACRGGDDAALAFAWHVAEERSIRRFARIFAQQRLPVREPCP